MSIANEIARISSEVNAQEELIQQIITALMDKNTTAPSGTLTVTSIGEYDVSQYEKVIVDIPDGSEVQY